MNSAAEISKLVSEQLAIIQDRKIRDHISSLLVVPYASERDWDYGHRGQKYVCWIVLEHRSSNTAIGYCSEGFGPKNPWGLLFIEGPHMSMGMDSGWYDTLEWTYRESFAFEEAQPDGTDNSGAAPLRV
jgi:hypothetical protein